MEFTITASSGVSFDVSADNWLCALGQIAGALDLDLEGLIKWQIATAPGGLIIVTDTRDARKWAIKPKIQVVRVVALAPVVAELPPEDPADEASASEASEPDAHSGEAATGPAEPPPLLTMPLTSSFAPPPTPEGKVVQRRPTDTESLGERLFDLSTDILNLTAEEACQLALKIIEEFVPCEASAVARGSIADLNLTIAAATGPVADEVRGKQIPVGSGYVSLAFDARIPIVVDDVRGDERHHPEIDAETGFQTRAVMAVPMLHGEDIYGVIQLINPALPFGPEDTDVVTQVAATLAEALSQQISQQLDF